MSLQYVIDGYNLIRHRSYAGCSRSKDDRRGLLEFIRSKRPCGSRKNMVTVVFDGYSGERSAREDDIEVIFSCDISADEKIRRILEAGPKNKNVIVVSDDRQVRETCRLYNATALGVEEFLAPKTARAGAKENESAKPELSSSQVRRINQELRDLWLKE